MSRLRVEFDTTHKMYKDYVIGAIHGLGMGILHFTNTGDKVKHFGLKKQDGKELMTFEGSDDQLHYIAEVIMKEYGGNAFKGLFRFSGSYPWND